MNELTSWGRVHQRDRGAKATKSTFTNRGVAGGAVPRRRRHGVVGRWRADLGERRLCWMDQRSVAAAAVGVGVVAAVVAVARPSDWVIGKVLRAGEAA